MSLNDILGSAISGLTASQAGLRTVSNNVANVGTPGYARQRVSLTAGVTAGRVNGVVVGEPERVAHRFLESTVYRLSGDTGLAEVRSSYLDRLQSLLGAPGAEGGLPARLDAISASAILMTSGPASAQSIAAFTGDVEDAIQSMKQLDGDVSVLRADVESEVGYTVDRMNGLLVRIHDLNDTIARLEGVGRSSAGPVDQRLMALEELSGLAKVTIRDQPDGRVTIETANGAVLLDRRLRQLNYPTPGTGVAQPIYPVIDIRFADGPDQLGAATGEKIDSAAVGGKLGGLIDLRDRALPRFSEQLGALFGGLSETLNVVSNAGTTLPPPTRLDGRSTGLVGTDRLGFTGQAVFAVTKSDGELIAKTSVDFSALGPTATVDDAVAAINAGLSPSATATFTGGRLTIQASSTGTGVAVAQDPTTPSDRAGIGFAQFFGLNDLVRSDDSALVPSGFVASDEHGFGAGETAELVLRDSGGRALTRFTLSPAPGGTFGDVVTALNAGALGSFGDFALDARGRVQFQPDPAVTGATLSITSDSTNRRGTGRSFSALSGISGLSAGLSSARVRPDILSTPANLPLARLETGVAVGAKAIGAGDNRGATAFVDQLEKPVDLGKDGVQSLERFSSQLLGRTGTEAARAEEARVDAFARRGDAANRRDTFSGVNIDEELAQMVVLQNSYSAAARVITTATEMYDTLIAMVR
ncbi:MAG: flagellar basal body protein [Pseudomonadota bacterium]|nr:flagellar basal body protein [Pseudomonadota bacterium]